MENVSTLTKNCTKKIWFLLLVASLLLTNISALAYSDATNQLITSAEQKMKTMTAQEQSTYLQTLKNTLTLPALQSNAPAEVQQIAQELDQRIKERVVEATAWLPPTQTPTSQQSYQTLPNVDFEKVRTARLGRHNDLRAKKNLKPYRYHSELERTAKKRADYLVSLGRRTHQRSAKDGYYSYPAIKVRFSDQGVKFTRETAGKSAFSESIGYRTYRCSSQDCTQELIDATKKIFDGFAAEWEGGPHYRALMMPHFTQMGLGFEFDPVKKYVYTVIHYGTEIEGT